MTYAIAAVASLLFVASIVFGADEFTNPSGQPAIQATVGAW
ncbi:hypothetical protein ACFPLB_04180 [Aquamicrobium segne]|uniref:Uncharacterized protein n=1 Tax=Aquamicrobium segne TaxID=469547 RepID=A0ABW0GU41_9HYPH